MARSNHCRPFLCSTQLALCVSFLSIIRLFEGGVLLTLIFCDPHAVAMRGGARLTSAEFTLFTRSGSTSRTANSQHLLRAEFFCQTNLHVQKGRQLDQFRKPIWTVYALLITDMGRFCRKALISALFICRPPL
jgi:hypothetical protein